MSAMIITIDGPTASGKSTVARLLAHKLSYYYLGSGLLFRALAHVLAPIIEFDQKKLTLLTDAVVDQLMKRITYCYSDKAGAQLLVDDKDITKELKGAESDYWASIIATHETVRNALLEIQRLIGAQNNLVIDGRDCGTVVFPNADYKFFLTASLETRAQRWLLEQKQKNTNYTLEESIVLIQERDQRDSQRTLSPLQPAADAYIIDNSQLTAEQTVDQLLKVLMPLSVS